MALLKGDKVAYIGCPLPQTSFYRQEENVDMRGWEAHVLSHVPFYTALFSLFLDLLRTRVSSRGDAALSDLIKVSHYAFKCLSSRPFPSTTYSSQKEAR